MKSTVFYLLGLALALNVVACSDDDPIVPTPEETPVTPEPAPEPEPESGYPANAIVWEAGSTVTLTDHLVIPKDSALYIEPGVTVVADNEDLHPEIVVLGNLYAMGTAEKPIKFTVPAEKVTERYCALWGGIICGYETKEVVLDHAILEYGGAATSDQSASWKNSLFKTEETGEVVPAFHFCNYTDGKFVITNCTFRFNQGDQIYITGGDCIVTNNLFYANGKDGEEAVNFKSGCQADIAYNLIYDANTNGFKLSNSGLSEAIPASHLVIYNNTVVNSGWRRPKVKGGSIWLESNIYADVFNNLVYDCRFGMKHSVEDVEDSRSLLSPNYYFASTEIGIEQMQENEEEGILHFDNDVKSLSAGEGDPLFVAFQQQADININAALEDDTQHVPADFDAAWDFHLQAASPALQGGLTNVSPLHTSPIQFAGLQQVAGATSSYGVEAPSAYFGAFGTK